MENYIKWLQEQGKRPNTIKRYESTLQDFIKWYEDTNDYQFKPENISTMDLNEWKQYLMEVAKTTRGKNKGKSLSVSTVATMIERLKPFFKYLVDTGKIQSDPGAFVKPPKIQNKNDVKWLDRIERNRLLKYLEDQELIEKNPWKSYRNMAIVYVMLQSGLRVSEVSNLKLNDVEDGFIYVRDGKGGKARKVPMNSDVAKVIEKWKKQRDIKGFESPFLFLSQKKGPLSVVGIENIFKTIRKNTGLEQLTPHVLRHTFGHDLIQKGIPISYVAELMGHSDMNTTRIYVTPGKQEKRNAVELLASGKYKD
ncbi:tyrosine-type recombinase/integrase [Bacillus cereus]|nr:tyrosine-type recombinase/integrase [Bacillus cereus]MEC3260697.1 tyrosine-type recombinase/integrase [Bacillus cereus]